VADSEKVDRRKRCRRGDPRSGGGEHPRRWLVLV